MKCLGCAKNPDAHEVCSIIRVTIAENKCFLTSSTVQDGAQSHQDDFLNQVIRGCDFTGDENDCGITMSILVG